MWDISDNLKVTGLRNILHLKLSIWATKLLFVFSWSKINFLNPQLLSHQNEKHIYVSFSNCNRELLYNPTKDRKMFQTSIPHPTTTQKLLLFGCWMFFWISLELSLFCNSLNFSLLVTILSQNDFFCIH